MLLVRADRLDEWPGLSADAGGHVLAPRDLVGTASGLQIEFDWCTERVERFLARRDGAGRALDAGEAVTLALSVCRGLGELAVGRRRREDRWPHGEWWLTDAACPVFVHGGVDGGASGGGAGETAQAILTRIAAQTADAAVSGAVARLARASDDELVDPHTEAGLFALADPLPLDTTALTPAPARSLDAAARLTGIPAEPAKGGRLSALLGRHLDADLSGLISDSVHAWTQRLRGRGRARRKPWLLAGGAAAVVLAVGLLWPEQSGTPAQADDVRPTAEATGSPAPEPVATAASPAASAASPDASAVSDPVGDTSALLDARQECRGVAECLAATVEDSSVELPSGAIDLPAEGREVTLLDEFGGVAVLRVRSLHDETAAQLVVIVESDGRWLLRDVHDVVEQGA